MITISNSLASLWAKKNNAGGMSWLPLAIHMADSAGVAKEMWRSWLPMGAKQTIANLLQWPEDACLDPEKNQNYASQALVFIAAIHDLGKSTPVFQAKTCSHSMPVALDAALMEDQLRAGLVMPQDSYKTCFPNADKSPHALATQLLLEKSGCNRHFAAILGSHHGKPASSMMLMNQKIESYQKNYYFNSSGREGWEAVQRETLQFALSLSGFSTLSQLPKPDMEAQVLLAGLAIMADWIASNETYFPYIDLGSDWQGMLLPQAMQSRADRGWHSLHLPPCWDAQDGSMGMELYPERFFLDNHDLFAPNAMQLAAAQVAQESLDPGIMVIEAPMGQGKTEAALVAAEIYAQKAGRSGIYFALPTQATSDGIFPRLQAWASMLDPGREHSIRLAHGKAQFNREYTKLFEGGSNIESDEADPLVVHPWFEGSKKSLLADFIVGTIDQMLMAALRQKHVMLRHIGLVNKVVIIDECHAYDAYMNQYLERVLGWLGSYGVPVIMLSATLPASKRRSMVEAYLGDRKPDKGEEKDCWGQSVGYPVITWTDGGSVNSLSPGADTASLAVELGQIALEEITKYLTGKLEEGGCIGLLFNTVKAAQQMADRLRTNFGDAVELLHSRFIAPDRAKKEEQLLDELGKPRIGRARPPLRIVVGTQVLEQSLDIDFDLLITQLCPMDLLLQRIGRLHRHKRRRPTAFTRARCLIIKDENTLIDKGSEYVYGRYLLMRTLAFLPPDGTMSLPGDIPKLVQAVYDEDIPLPGESDEYGRSRAEWHEHVEKQESRAKRFRVSSADMCRMKGIISWLDLSAEDSEHAGEANVRDTDESIEVLLVTIRGGAIRFLPWQENGMSLPHGSPLSPKDAEALARQRIRLPSPLCMPHAISNTIKELEQMSRCCQAWYVSPWIKGELLLILDESLSASLSGYRIHYSQKDGMSYEKEGQ